MLNVSSKRLLFPPTIAAWETSAPTTAGATATAAAATHYYDAAAEHETTDGRAAPAGDGPGHRAADPSPADTGPAEHQSARDGPGTARWVRLYWGLVVIRCIDVCIFVFYKQKPSVQPGSLVLLIGCNTLHL